MDLGSLFLSFLQFYSEPNHFDVTRHAIDVVVPSGFAQKHMVQVRSHVAPAVHLMFLCSVLGRDATADGRVSVADFSASTKGPACADDPSGDAVPALRRVVL